MNDTFMYIPNYYKQNYPFYVASHKPFEGL